MLAEIKSIIFQSEENIKKELAKKVEEIQKDHSKEIDSLRSQLLQSQNENKQLLL